MVLRPAWSPAKRRVETRRDGAWQASGIRESIQPGANVQEKRNPADAGRSRAMSTVGASIDARPVVGLGQTERVAALLAGNCARLRPTRLPCGCGRSTIISPPDAP
jgi:hypothetical protein